MKLQLEVSANLNKHVSVYVFVNDENCGCLCLDKKDFKELCDGFRKIYADFEVKEE
jgi:hypothetical protein